NVLENRCCDQRIEDDRNLLRLDLARAQATKRALGGDFAYMLRRFKSGEIARNREPVVALHRPLFVLRNRNRRDRAIRASIFANKAMRIRKNFVAGGGVE